MKVWLDGKILDDTAAAIAPTDRGFTLGDGLFEILKVVGGKPLRLASHLARLHAGAGALGIPLPLGDKDFGLAMTALLEANGLSNAVLRLTLTRGPAAPGLATPTEPRPTLLILAAAPPAEPPPARAIIATTTRRNEHSPASRFKTLNYLDNLLARREAEQKGADEALLLNGQGRLAGSAAANLFVVIDGDVLTPPVSEGALPGVMRAEVIDRLSAATSQLHPADLGTASEAFLTNACGIRALVSVDGRPIGKGREGPLTTRLKSAVS
ncbi:MAG TPA: 2-keto-4-methylthiobutyrate aminotransferase [Rhodospirillaceae bacterium]|nr:2-keto-4-methylthiobutyrate aminotransferase [Rhodospirillaceae bacterium]